MPPETIQLAALTSDHLDPAEWPTILHLQQSPDQLQLELQIPDSLSWFRGHFPSNPVLPGIVQVHWAVSLINWLLPQPGCFHRIDNLKFKAIVMPEALLRLDIKTGKNQGQLQFCYRSADNDQVHSEGKVIYQ